MIDKEIMAREMKIIGFLLLLIFGLLFPIISEKLFPQDTYRPGSAQRTMLINKVEADPDSSRIEMGDGVWRNSVISSLTNTVSNIGGQGFGDSGMGAFYERNELSFCGQRGIITVAYSSGIWTDGTPAMKNRCVDGASSPMLFTGVDEATDSVQIKFQLPANVVNNGFEQWQPFCQFSDPYDSTRFPLPDSISVLVSADGSTWYAPDTTECWSSDSLATHTFNGMWFGKTLNPGIAAWKYARFTFRNFRSHTSQHYFYIAELGIRHPDAATTKAFMSANGWRSIKTVDGATVSTLTPAYEDTVVFKGGTGIDVLANAAANKDTVKVSIDANIVATKTYVDDKFYGIPAGSDGQVQFNDNGEMGASSNFNFNKNYNYLTIGNNTATNYPLDIIGVGGSTANKYLQLRLASRIPNSVNTLYSGFVTRSFTGGLDVVGLFANSGASSTTYYWGGYLGNTLFTSCTNHIIVTAPTVGAVGVERLSIMPNGSIVINSNGLAGTSLLSFGSNIIGTALYPSIDVLRSSGASPSSDGMDLTITAGGARASQSNKPGGSLVLRGGIATGNVGSSVLIKTATPGATGTADRTPSTKLTIDGNGLATLNGTGLVLGNAAVAAGKLTFNEDTDDGANFSSFTVAPQAANLAYTLPAAIVDGGRLTTNASGTLSWTTPTTGTVTSVGLSMPTQFTVTNSPVTSTGTLTAAWNNQVKNLVFASPASGADGVPTFRTLVADDVPIATGHDWTVVNTRKFYAGDLTIKNASGTHTSSFSSPTNAAADSILFKLTVAGNDSDMLKIGKRGKNASTVASQAKLSNTIGAVERSWIKFLGTSPYTIYVSPGLHSMGDITLQGTSKVDGVDVSVLGTNYANHAANNNTNEQHLTTTQKTALTGGSNTTLHTHDIYMTKAAIDTTADGRWFKITHGSLTPRYAPRYAAADTTGKW